MRAAQGDSHGAFVYAVPPATTTERVKMTEAPVLPPELPDGQIVGPAAELPAEPDYFGASERTEKWYLPGSKTQYIEFKIMNEGARKKWQRKTSRDVKVSRKDQSAAISMDAAGDREALFEAVVIGWTIIDPTTKQVAPFNNNGPGGLFMQWCNRRDPDLIDKLEIAIRDAHPWMQDEMDPESIREEITRLEKLEAEAIARREAKENF